MLPGIRVCYGCVVCGYYGLTFWLVGLLGFSGDCCFSVGWFWWCVGFLGFLNCGLCVNLVCLCIYSIWFLVLGLFVNFVVWCGDVVWCC